MSDDTEFVSLMWLLEYHTMTQLPDGRLSWIVDPGAWSNIIGLELAKKMVRKAIDAGLKATQEKRRTPLRVAGVGNGSNTASWDMTCPLAITDAHEETTPHSITAAIVEDTGKELPGLLGLQALEKIGAILDTRGKQLIIPAPGEQKLTLELSPGATVLPLEKAPSGHLVLVTDSYAKLQNKGGLPKRQIIFLANTHPNDDPPNEPQSSSSEGLKVTVGDDATAPLSLALLQTENERLRNKVEDLERQLRQRQPHKADKERNMTSRGEMSGSSLDQPGRIDRGGPGVTEEADGDADSTPIEVQQHAYRSRHGISSPRQ